MSPGPREKLLIVLPAYNAEKTLAATVASVPKDLNADFYLVDDGSRDGTVRLARELGLPHESHPGNLGYGANQKTCYRRALASDAGIVVMIHPDYQYDARMIPALILPIRLGICDVMLGNRVRTRREALEGGMPLYKYLANRALTILENLLLGQNLGEFHSGMRAYRREVLETVPWQNNSDGFVFDQQFLIQSTFLKFRIGDVPVPAKYFPEASSIGFLRSAQYGIQTLLTLASYLLARNLGLKRRLFRSPKDGGPPS
ncbi:MAG: glycosyl transferase family 2 [Elusimicrobia bacterium RIFCSPLOWO2_01_FULL_64_13]|nr:MAG: glycosyl transferase family 2 [Elusimicrobia bacterium RIFCSPHIGHO2_01_FULL_64_10]OGR95037.1 MAG: glycosyl transferase family 2 [Elusimicrobia bacterium RIFCSPLOWO2_01_FULL_64_13]